MMSLTMIFSSSPTPKPRSNEAAVSAQAAGESFSSLPSTRKTSGMLAKVLGSVCAAQPVTTMRAAGRSRLSFRMVCRAWRTASAVTAQVLITIVSCSALASRRMISDS